MNKTRKKPAEKTGISWLDRENAQRDRSKLREEMNAMRFDVVDEKNGNVYAGLSDIGMDHCLFTQDPPVTWPDRMNVGDRSKLASDNGLLLVRTK